MVLGIICSIFTGLFYSLYAVPRKFTKINGVLYVAILGLMSTVFCLIFYFATNKTSLGYNENFFDVWNLLSSLQGFLWFVAILLLMWAIDKIGISKTGPLRVFQAPIASILLILFLNDSTGKIWYVVGGLVLMLVAAFSFAIKGNKEKDKKNIGIIYGLLAAACFGLTAFLQKYTTREGLILSRNVYLSFFIFLPALIYFLVKYKKPKDLLPFKKVTTNTELPPKVTVSPIDLQVDKLVENEKLQAINNTIEPSTEQTQVTQLSKLVFKKDFIFPIIAGFLCAVMITFQAFAFKLLSDRTSVAYTIIQSNALWTISIGIIFFKEIDFKKNWIRISLGLACTVGAIVLMFFTA